jgi:hypothetical protein
MSDERGLQTMQQLVRRECRSLIQYVADAYPWTSASHAEDANRLRGLIAAEREALGSLARYLLRHKLPPPHTGGFPVEFTGLNFVDLGYIVSLLIKTEQESIQQIETDLASVEDEEGRQLAENLLALKQQHLDALHQLQQPEPAVTP